MSNIDRGCRKPCTPNYLRCHRVTRTARDAMSGIQHTATSIRQKLRQDGDDGSELWKRPAIKDRQRVD